MKADFRASRSEFEASARLQAQQGRLAGRQWSGSRRPDNDDDPRRGKTGVPKKRCELGKKLTEGPGRLQGPPHDQAASWMQPAKMIESGEGIDWATAERWPSARWSRKASRSACRARMRARHVLAAPFGSLRSGNRGTLHAARHISPNQAATKSSTRCCRKKRCSASNTATRWPSRTR
jgi:hypothetical protein